MKKIRLSVVPLLAFFSFCLMACQPKAKPSDPNAKSWEAPLNDMLPGTIVRNIKSKGLVANLPIKLEDKNGKPLQGALFLIGKGSDSSIALKSNSDGVITIRLTRELLTQNPIIVISKEGLLAKDISYEVGGKTMKFVDGESVEAEVIQFDNLRFIDKEGLRVYYVINEEAAERYTDSFNYALNFIKEITGKGQLNPVTPVLTGKQDISIMGEPEGTAILPVDITDWQDKYWFYIHESVENDLINTKNVYSTNPNLRWIGDGLAEFVSLKFLTHKGGGYKEKMLENRLASLGKFPEEELNLYEWKTGDTRIAGYSFSLAFWLKMEKQHGLKGIQLFIKQFSDLKTYDIASIEQIYLLSFGKKFNAEDLVISQKEATEIFGRP